MGHVEGETAGSEVPGVCVTSAWADDGRMKKGVSGEERMQDGNPAAGLAAASFIWLEILRGFSAFGASLFNRLGLNLATPVASFCHRTANSTGFQATGQLPFMH